MSARAPDVERYLCAWADWCQRRRDAVGWPRCNILARFVDEGGILTRATGGGVVLAACDPWLLRTDAAVAALAQASQPLYATLLAKLFEPGTDARRARALGITTECFETRWRRAKARVGRHLCASRKLPNAPGDRPRAGA